MPQQPREKIKPVFDVPLVLQMESIYGEETTSKFTGVEYRYQVMYENRPAFIYLPAEGRDAIQRTRPEAGDFIELLKQKRNGRIVYSAQPYSDANEPPPPPVRQIARYEEPPPQPQQPPRNGMRVIAPPPAWEDYRDEEEPPPLRRGYQNGHANGQAGNGHTGEYQAQAQPPRPAAREVHPITQQMAGCLRWSFDAWEELRNYALSKGRQVDYSSEDIRATANTLYMRGGNTR